MSKINTLIITDLIFGSVEKHESDLDNAINANPEYAEAAARANEHYEKVKKLDAELWLEMEADLITLETISRDAAFNEGFRLAVRLIFSSIQ